MGLVTGDESSHFDDQESNAPEEKILVAVRLRPLNEREIMHKDVSDWECINNDTILLKNNLAERSMLPVAYSFDRVFGCDSTTRQVYEDAAKRVALSVMSGINSSIFAYGQTSSGKTYTMCGITEYAVADIYDYIDKHAIREFVLKFSAMEIYNEAVKDLLSTDDIPLRLLDDPERGTIVEKLTEVTLRDWSHLKELLSVCEAHRKVGETSLNEMSSRSHQILRLTVESSAREYKHSENSSTLAATVHFVDLAGSERASQALSAGARLKEGCHINRSLLTLGTVIRKLSKGRNGHVPYRDSKLTRILQNSLGGNARTAIICTMSPAQSHMEQSRNTLLFASCAKKVSTNAQVNVVMSEKALVKQLQRELARLESQLKNLGTLSTSCDSLALKEKELVIEKMDKEIRELTQQRDQAHSRLQSLLSSTADDQISRPCDELSSISGSQEKVAWLDGYSGYSVREESVMIDPLGFAYSESHFPDPSDEQFLSDDISPRMFIEKYFGPDPTQGWEKTTQRTDQNDEDNCKEVQCIETEVSMRNINSDAVHSLGNGEQVSGDAGIHLDDDIFESKVQDSQENPDYLVDSHPSEQFPCSSGADLSGPKNIVVSGSTSYEAIIMAMPPSPRSQTPKEDQNTANGFEKDSHASEERKDKKLSELEPAACGKELRRGNSEESLASDSDDKLHNTKSSSVDVVIKSKSDKQFMGNLTLDAEQTLKILEKTSDNGLAGAHESPQSPSDWFVEFERQRAEIIELWDACKIPLVHRSYFFVVFKGDPSDSIYMEVELRRLSYLKMYQGTNNVKMGQIFKQASSIRAINRERQMLSKLMLKKLSSKEREALFEKWGIGLKTKQRRLQLSRRLWTDTKDMEHIKESAALIAKLIGFTEPSQAPKEMVGLSFSNPEVKFRSVNWT